MMTSSVPELTSKAVDFKCKVHVKYVLRWIMRMTPMQLHLLLSRRVLRIVNGVRGEGKAVMGGGD